jgi:cyclic pyranopterin phosphate synthase
MYAEEIGQIVNLASEFGIRKIKLTGGEPLLRKDIVEIVTAVVTSDVKEVSITTNGTLLAKIATELADAGLSRVNISLDTLDPHVYAKITGTPKLDRVLEGIDAALDAGLRPVKLNMLVLRGINDGEVERVMDYALNRGAILQILELLRTPDTAEIYERFHANLEPFERKLRERASDIKTRRLMQARKRYILPEGEVEVVRSMHNSEFCAHCTRLRLTPDGYLKPCLMRNDNLVDVLSSVRKGDLEGAREAFTEAIARREPYFKG